MPPPNFHVDSALPFAQGVATRLSDSRVCHLLGEQLREQLAFFDQRSWREFAGSWNNLCLDALKQDKGRYRLRRCLEWEVHSGLREPRRPAYRPQTLLPPYRPPGSAPERPGEPVEEHVVSNAFFTGLMRWALGVFEQLEGQRNWRVQVFQKRTVATPRWVAPPSRDAGRQGVTYLLAMLIKRTNARGGETTFYDRTGAELGRMMMLHPMDCLLAHDEQVLHGVTPLLADSQKENACSDVMIARFTRR